jgi:hypothetical protein
MFRWVPPGVELLQDVSAADWIIERLRPWGEDSVRLWSFMPDAFEAYARIFHPPGHRPAGRDVPRREFVTWADLARERGVRLTADVAFTEVAQIEAAGEDYEPDEGELPWDVCDAVAGALRPPHTATPNECWFCLWEGSGAFWSKAHGPLYPHDASPEERARYLAEARRQDDILKATPRVHTQHRSYFLFRGSLDGACGFFDGGTSPNLWWPQDRAWLVSTEVDGFSTYVGGTSNAIEDVVSSSGLEALRVPVDVHMDPGIYSPRYR